MFLKTLFIGDLESTKKMFGANWPEAFGQDKLLCYETVGEGPRF
jgi:hypothetical protein